VVSTARSPDPKLLYAGELLLAPLPSGWVVAGATSVDIYVHSFDAAGRHLARKAVDTLADDALYAPPVIAARPDGGPLLTWVSNDGLRAVVVSADGRSATAPIVVTREISGTPLSAAHVGNAFYVARTVERPGNYEQLNLTRIETDGRVTGAIDALPGTAVSSPQLVPGADDLRLIYMGSVPSPGGADPTWSLLWQRLAPTGAAATPPLAVTDQRDFYGDGRAVAFGGDTAVMLWGFGDAFPLRLARVASNATLVPPTRLIAGGPPIGASWFRTIVRRGPEAVVLWLSETGNIQLARILP
jgi:hypothetical protein